MIGRLPSYSIATAFSLSLHGVLLTIVIAGWFPQRNDERVRPNYIQATLLQVEPSKPPTRSEELDQSLKQAAKEKQLKIKQAVDRDKLEAERIKAVQLKQKQREEAARKERKRREAEAKILAEQKALQREQELAFVEALENEEQFIVAGQDEQLVNSYSAYIVERITRNWSRPPSARRGMQVILSIRMVPTGEIVSVVVERSSGNAAFDRSAEQAVHKVERFEKLQELSQTSPRVFESTFRSFRLVFRPDDLRL
jgi:colicin import membrane protein